MIHNKILLQKNNVLIIKIGARHLLKSGLIHHHKLSHNDASSEKPEFIGALSSGLNRRAFLRQSSIAVMFTSIAACKPNISTDSPEIKTALANNTPDENISLFETYTFNQHQKDTLIAVQMQLFPEDGDGPSANDVNALTYLEWALTDTDNDADGDGEFITKGIGWLDGLAEQTQGSQFKKLSIAQQDKVLQQISQSSAGENWMSLLIYYLMEALLFDPYYGGNPNSIGWTWLKHQPGFPAPDETTHYRRFL